mmetsp:Transcript_25279/g.53311  ORF Transcript_25279/g.53311 Transcript_25279/m.53311 type:complete len:158 (+) Transcript_25279:1286-1759(+)
MVFLCGLLQSKIGKSWRKRRMRTGKVAGQGCAKRWHRKMCNINQLEEVGSKEQLIAVRTMKGTFKAWSWTKTQVGSPKITRSSTLQIRMATWQRIWFIFFIPETCHDCCGRIPTVDGLSIRESNKICLEEMGGRYWISFGNDRLGKGGEQGWGQKIL